MSKGVGSGCSSSISGSTRPGSGFSPLRSGSARPSSAQLGSAPARATRDIGATLKLTETRNPYQWLGRVVPNGTGKGREEKGVACQPSVGQSRGPGRGRGRPGQAGSALASRMPCSVLLCWQLCSVWLASPCRAMLRRTVRCGTRPVGRGQQSAGDVFRGAITACQLRSAPSRPAPTRSPCRCRVV